MSIEKEWDSMSDDELDAEIEHVDRMGAYTIAMLDLMIEYETELTDEAFNKMCDEWLEMITSIKENHARTYHLIVVKSTEHDRTYLSWLMQGSRKKLRDALDGAREKFNILFDGKYRQIMIDARDMVKEKMKGVDLEKLLADGENEK